MTDSQQNAWLDAVLANTLAGKPVQNISVDYPDISIGDATHYSASLLGNYKTMAVGAESMATKRP